MSRRRRASLLFLFLLLGCEYKKIDKAPVADAAPAIEAAAPAAKPSEPKQPAGVAIDAENVYWTTNWDFQGVRRMPRGDAGTPAITTVCKLDDRFLTTGALLVTEAHVYFLGSRTVGGALYRAPKGALDAACETVFEIDRPKGLTRIGKTIYVAGTNKVMAVDDASKRTVLDAPPMSIDSITNDGTNLFVSDRTTISRIENGKLVEVGPGGANVQFAAGRFFSMNLGAVTSLPASGGKATMKIGSDVNSTFFVLGETVYMSGKISARSLATIKKSSINVDKSTDVTTAQDSVHTIIGDARDLYIGTSREILRVAP